MCSQCIKVDKSKKVNIKKKAPIPLHDFKMTSNYGCIWNAGIKLINPKRR